jgi:hypothetical protein
LQPLPDGTTAGWLSCLFVASRGDQQDPLGPQAPSTPISPFQGEKKTRFPDQPASGALGRDAV